MGLEGGLESARSRRAVVGETSIGSVWAAHRWLTLYGKLGVPLGSRIVLLAMVGIRGWQIEAGATGFTTTQTQSLLRPGAALTLGTEIKLGSFLVLIRAVGAARFSEERLRVEGFGPVLLLKWWQVGAFAGLGWHFP